MPDDDQSLGDQNTFDGGSETPGSSQQSLGDEATFGGGVGSVDDAFDDDMEVVDLAARYTTEGTLGKGGMGEVLLATDTRLNRKVAIKRILGSAASSKTAVSRFLTEAQSIAALNHPNIVQIYDFGCAKDGPFLIMEFVEGSSLLDKCREGALPLEEAVDLTCQLCEGLSRAHAANIVHRDIKPANVLLTEDGVPKLTDFGLAKDEAADTGMTMAGAVLGTLDFMPPEQRKDAALTDNRSDLWSLAATLYQMLTGESPRVIDLNEVPSELRKCIAQALKRKKEDRFQSANELRDALRASLKTTQLVDETPVDLGAGECPKCHARNDANRKFCNGCGGSLRVTCLACVAEMPVWETFCGECGGNQADLLEQKATEYQERQREAESRRGGCQFTESLAIAGDLAAIEDERFAAFRDWGNSFAEEVRSEQDRLNKEAKQHFEEAKKHREAFDYSTAIHAIELIPEALRSLSMQGYLDQLVSDQDESQQLLADIKQAITNRSLDDLLPKVRRALDLRGDHQDLPKLKSQLLDRQQKLERQRSEAYEAAARLLDQGDAKGALSKIKPVKMKILRPSQERLRAKLDKIIKAERSLTQLVADCKADGVIEPAEVWEILPAVAAYLELNPKHTGIQRLQEDLLTRIKRNPESHAEFFTATVFETLPPVVLSNLPPITNSIGMQLKLIHAGTFRMGEGNDAHEVTLTRDFYLGVHEVTQQQYANVMGSQASVGPRKFKGAQNPVMQVSWNDAVEFCKRLSLLPAERAARRVYRLPSEAEWEYACRAGTTADPSNLGNYAWYESNSGTMPHPVGLKQPNAWGLYDMYGNVWEWCQDWYGDYPNGSVTDPTGPASGSDRVYRGGCWINTARSCRSSSRSGYVPGRTRDISLGFRVASVPSSGPDQDAVDFVDDLELQLEISLADLNLRLTD